MGGLLGVWNWVTGKKKCDKCGSYDTQQVEKKLLESEQRWEPDFAYIDFKNNTRPQAVFTRSYYGIVSKCNDCEDLFYDVDFVKRRA